MKISKQDALAWFEFFAVLPEDEELRAKQQEIAYGALSQIEAVVDKRNEELLAQISGLKTLENRTLYVGPEEKFPQGCRSCLLGTGLSAVRKTNRCNLECNFCYNYGQLDDISPVGGGMWEIGGTKFYVQDLDLLLAIHTKPTGIAYVYLEPFLEIETYLPVIKKFSVAGIHQHMYTNGTLASAASLRGLGDAGLNEIRFNLGASSCADHVIANMRYAKDSIPRVGIETPMTPQFFAQFAEKKKEIMATGLDFINCAELHVNENNIDNFYGENMYMCRQGYISPIWSRELTLKFMKAAADENWDLAVHDCSNYTKFARGLNLGNKQGLWFGSSNYACEFPRLPFEAFLPVLRDSNFRFLVEEPLPPGYRPGELVY
jgi:pyruvate formate-lyase activating enzyme-like uncharacterized protein